MKIENGRTYLVRENYDVNRTEHAAWWWDLARTEDGIAMLSMTTELSNHYETWFFEIPLYKQLSAKVESLMSNENVKAIILLLDSPGGDVSGLFECADAIWNMHEEKPIYACINGGMACSAAYLLAASTGKIYATETSEIGSCGVMCTAVNSDGYWEKQGIKIKKFFSKNAKKKNLSPFSEEGAKTTQKSIDQIEDFYYERLSDYRGMDKEKCISDFGGGEVFFAAEALDRAMIDKVCTLDELLTEIRESITEQPVAPDANINFSSLQKEDEGGLLMGEKPVLSREEISAALKDYPDLFEPYLEAGAEKERKRIAELNAVRSECTAAIIDKALEEKKSLADISEELISAYKAENDRLNGRVKEMEDKLAVFEPIKNQAENTQEVKIPAGASADRTAEQKGYEAAITVFGGKEEVK